MDAFKSKYSKLGIWQLILHSHGVFLYSSCPPADPHAHSSLYGQHRILYSSFHFGMIL